ncbi:hypothetical protein ABZ348_28170 [Streptomyces sp. NPDC005963]|uniref:hypothetical protein n=1 Tax=Streptomyces sp. NPDC005963 TaxID=3156721 RepID=UPI0033D4A456
MAYGRVLRTCCGVLACGLLWTGCSDQQPQEPPESKGGGASSGAAPTGAQDPSPGPSRLDFRPDPAKAPRTEADARRLAEAAIAGPDLWGPGFVKRAPFLSAPGHWPVLDDDCVWQGGTRPAGVLYSLTSYSERPATGAKGPLRVAATITVHRDVKGADWEMADTLEEALRCPDQRLRDGERITHLMSLGSVYGTGNNLTSEDSIGEIGKYHNAAFDGPPQEYGWFQSRLGQVTVATVTKGAAGYTPGEINTSRVEAMVGMMNRLEKQLEGSE